MSEQLTAVRWRPFRLELRQRFEAAHEALHDRAGVLLELTAEDGVRGIGEASPMPSLGGGTVADVLALLERHAARLLGDRVVQPDDRPADDAEGPGATALRCAIDVASLDLEARRAGVPVAALLVDAPADSVLVNAVIGNGEPAQVAAYAREATAAGYGVLKLKVGVGSLEHDEACLAAIREACPDAVVRLDANGAWDEATAIAALPRLAAFGVDFIEQPVPADQVQVLARVREHAPFPVAADEAVGTRASAEKVLEQRAADLLVLKPMVLGGVQDALELATRAARVGIGSFVTTTFDSSIGTAAALHLAAALPWVAAQGLSTGEHLATDLVADPLLPREGRLAVRGPGLGVVVDEQHLEAAATGPWVEVRS